MQHQPGRRELRLHIRQHPLQPLELADRPPELLPLPHERQSQIKRSGRNPHRHRPRPHALAVIGIDQIGKPPPIPIGRRQRHVVRHLQITKLKPPLRHPAQPQRRLAVHHLQPRRRPDRDEPANPQFPPALVEGEGKNQMQLRNPRPGDPVLRTIDDPPIPPPIRPRRHRRRVRPRSRLGDADRRLIPRQHQPRRQPLLRRRAIGNNRADCPHIALNHDPRRHRAGLRHLLHHQRRLQERPPPSPERHRDRHPHEPLAHQRRHDIMRIFPAEIDRRGPRPHDAIREIPRMGLQVPLVECQHCLP